jgi:hypothetical protein
MVGLNLGLCTFCCPYHQSFDCKVNEEKKICTYYSIVILVLYPLLNFYGFVSNKNIVGNSVLTSLSNVDVSYFNTRGG